MGGRLSFSFHLLTARQKPVFPITCSRANQSVATGISVSGETRASLVSAPLEHVGKVCSQQRPSRKWPYETRLMTFDWTFEKVFDK